MINRVPEIYRQVVFEEEDPFFDPSIDIEGVYSLISLECSVFFVHVTKYKKRCNDYLCFPSETAFLDKYKRNVDMLCSLPDIIPVFVNEKYTLHIEPVPVRKEDVKRIASLNSKVKMYGIRNGQQFPYCMKYVPASLFIVQEQHFDTLRNYNIREDVKGLYGLSEKNGDVWFTGEIEFLKQYEHPGIIVDFRTEVFDDFFARFYNSSAMETNRIVIADPFNSYRHVCTYLGKIRNHLTLSEVKERCPKVQAVIYETDNSCYSVNLEYSDHFYFV